MTDGNISLLIFFAFNVYVIVTIIRWLLKLFGYGYPYYMNITYTKYGIQYCERFYIVDDEHLVDILSNLYGMNDE